MCETRMAKRGWEGVGSNSFHIGCQVLWYYEYPTVTTVCWTSLFSAFCPCWGLVPESPHLFLCFLSYTACTVSSSKPIHCAGSSPFSSMAARYSLSPLLHEPGYARSAVLYCIYLAMVKFSFCCHGGKIGHVASASSTALWKEMEKQQRSIMENGILVSIMDTAIA